MAFNPNFDDDFYDMSRDSYYSQSDTLLNEDPPPIIQEDRNANNASGDVILLNEDISPSPIIQRDTLQNDLNQNDVIMIPAPNNPLNVGNLSVVDDDFYNPESDVLYFPDLASSQNADVEILTTPNQLSNIPTTSTGLQLNSSSTNDQNLSTNQNVAMKRPISSLMDYGDDWHDTTKDFEYYCSPANVSNVSKRSRVSMDSSDVSLNQSSTTPRISLNSTTPVTQDFSNLSVSPGVSQNLSNLDPGPTSNLQNISNSLNTSPIRATATPCNSHPPIGLDLSPDVSNAQNLSNIPSSLNTSPIRAPVTLRTGTSSNTSVIQDSALSSATSNLQNISNSLNTSPVRATASPRNSHPPIGLDLSPDVSNAHNISNSSNTSPIRNSISPINQTPDLSPDVSNAQNLSNSSNMSPIRAPVTLRTGTSPNTSVTQNSALSPGPTSNLQNISNLPNSPDTSNSSPHLSNSSQLVPATSSSAASPTQNENSDLVNSILPTAHSLSLLKNYYGHSQFRPLQWQIISNALKRIDQIVIMSTGYGKSLCFQLPALINSNVTLVISPLISLMEDQVENLKDLNIKAVTMNSISKHSKIEVVNMVLRNAVHVLYTTPETYSKNEDLFKKMKPRIGLVAIDEVHCVSQWGHNFRSAYLFDFRAIFFDVPFMALTATATEAVLNDIRRNLKMENAITIMTGFDRPNLYIEVVKKTHYKNFWEFPETVSGDLSTQLKRDENGELSFGGPTIVYCTTQKEVNEVKRILLEMGVKCGRYHADLSKEEKRKTHMDFRDDAISTVVATLAFGMGIDKKNLRNIIHYGHTKTLEGYYQEIGRAGRDGMPSKCKMYFSESDETLFRKFIDDDFEKAKFKIKLAIEKNELIDVKKEEDFAQKVKIHSEEMLKKVIRFIYTKDCRRYKILSYFDPNAKYPEVFNPNCCDNCRRKFQTKDSGSKVDYGTFARNLFQIIAEFFEDKVPLTQLMAILFKEKLNRHLKISIESTDLYGCGRTKSKKWWGSLIEKLEDCGYLTETKSLITQVESLIRLTPRSRHFLYYKHKVLMLDKLSGDTSENINRSNVRDPFNQIYWEPVGSYGLIDAFFGGGSCYTPGDDCSDGANGLPTPNYSAGGANCLAGANYPPGGYSRADSRRRRYANSSDDEPPQIPVQKSKKKRSKKAKTTILVRSTTKKVEKSRQIQVGESGHKSWVQQPRHYMNSSDEDEENAIPSGLLVVKKKSKKRVRKCQQSRVVESIRNSSTTSASSTSSSSRLLSSDEQEGSISDGLSSFVVDDDEDLTIYSSSSSDGLSSFIVGSVSEVERDHDYRPPANWDDDSDNSVDEEEQESEGSVISALSSDFEYDL